MLPFVTETRNVAVVAAVGEASAPTTPRCSVASLRSSAGGGADNPQCVEHLFSANDYDAMIADGARACAYSETLPIVDAVLQGKHAAIMAYGQTGSGKVRYRILILK